MLFLTFMVTNGAARLSNRLLGALPASSRKRIAPFLERVALRPGTILTRNGAAISDLYFVESGMVSLVKWMKNGQAIEIGAVGYEGIAPPAAIFNLQRAVLESVVQIGGSALRIRQEDLRKLLAQDRDLSQMMISYAEVAMSLLAQTAACNILHGVEERCCRWLLTAHDSARSDAFPLTHEYLGLMLGVRRASISVAAENLQRFGFIDYGRGKVRVSDRLGLEKAACECYATMQAELNALVLKQ
jgi:CRP-like cAMP-binding protein